jgi:Ca2+-binding RTX toxin-like protein
VTHARFETVTVQNGGTSTGTTGLVGETGDLIVVDNEGVDSDLTVTVTDTDVTVESGSGPITVDPTDGTQLDPNSIVVPLDGITGGNVDVITGEGDDGLTVDLTASTSAVGLNINFDGGAGFDNLTLRSSSDTVLHIFNDSSSGSVYFAEDEFVNSGSVTGVISGSLLAPEDIFPENSDIVQYDGLEPVDMLGVVTSHLIFALPDTDNSAVIEAGDGVGEFRLRSLNGTFETTDFVPPAEGIFVLGGVGDDIIDASAVNFRVEMFGREGNDTLIGGSASDALFGGSGDDSLNGNSNNDLLKGDSGDDTLSGGLGNDTLNGAAGDDSLLGGDDDDTLVGGAGADLLDGGTGDDRLSGQGGSGDTLDGGEGNDLLNGGAGIDFVQISVNADITLQNSQSTGEGTDTLVQLERAILRGGWTNNLIDASAFDGPVRAFGGAGRDTILGGSDNDTLIGGAGGDELRGGGGDDTLRGSAGRDTLQGDAGNDALFGQGGSRDRLDGGLGNDTLDGGAGIDILVASADVDFTLSDSLLTGQGVDTIRRLEQAELTGGVSANNINASAFSGVTRLNGKSGNDTILGGSAADVIAGGAGSDSLVGGGGNDRLLGQGGSGDTLIGDAGTDTLDGGSGSDTINTDILDSVIVDALDVIIGI